MVLYWKRRRKFGKNRYYNKRWKTKFFKNKANKNNKIYKNNKRLKASSMVLPLKKVTPFLIKKGFKKKRFFLNYQRFNLSLWEKKQVEGRIKLGQELKNFWGSFIKKGVRPNKIYFYVLKKFRALTGKNIVFFYKLALEMLRPIVYYKPRRFGAFIHLIPRMISKKLGFNLAKRFLVKAIHKRKELYLGDRIVNELLDVTSSKSSAFYYKRDVYSEVVENRVYMRRRRGKKSF